MGILTEKADSAGGKRVFERRVLIIGVFAPPPNFQFGGQQESRGSESPTDSAGGKRVRRSCVACRRRYRAS